MVQRDVPDGVAPRSDPATDGTPGEPARTAAHRDRDGPLRVFYPAYGPIDSVLGFGLFYLLVDLATPLLAEALAGLLGVESAAVETFAAVLLWAVFAATAFGAVLTQTADNPRTFDDRTEREAFLAANRPRPWEYRLHVALATLGGAVAALAWETFVVVFEALLPAVVELDGTVPAVLTPGNVAAFVVFFLGFAAFSRGLDRLVIGTLRESLYRRYRA